MKRNARIFVAGHTGLVGSAITRRLVREGFDNLLLRALDELDLTDRRATLAFFEKERPEVVILAAARVGGIQANDTLGGDFIRDNLYIQANTIDAARLVGVDRFVFLGSSCIYPKLAKQPISESELLTGPLETTNDAYAIAKIAGIKMVQAYRKQYGFPGISVMPTNLYGPGDNFSLEESHVLPALLRKVHEAKEGGKSHAVAWGTGQVYREFLHVDDLADAVLFLTERYDDPSVINIGTGDDLTIAKLAELICDVVGFKGEIVWDSNKPDGTPRKLLDVGKLTALGWRARIGLREGIEKTYRWFVEHRAEARS